ncbi:unnamed protein product [Alternaria alternata]
MHSMLSAIVNQIATYDKAFCDQAATTITSIREDIVTPDAVARFEKFLAFKFKETALDELAEAEKIHIAKDEIKNDVQVIAASKMKHASRLRKLRPAAKRIVENTLVEQFDCSFVHGPSTSSTQQISSRKSVPTALSELPKGLDGLYCKLEEEAAARRTLDELQTVRLAYTWIAFAKQSISVE